MTLDCGVIRNSVLVSIRVGKLIYCTSFIRYYFRKNEQRYQTLLPTGNIPETPITWKKPEPLPFNHPWKTGDFVTKNEPIDMTGHPDIIADSPELAKASDAVKRMFSFDFLGRTYAQKQIQENMIASVRNHRYDDFSFEATIAAFTATIRNFNEHLETKPYDRPVRKILNCLIFTRFHKIELLRQCDYKRFEWLLEKLDLFYQPRQSEYLLPKREDSIRTLTEQYIENYKQQKLSKYREKLDDQKEEFLKEKVASLIWMRKEEIECGVQEPSITTKIIENAEKQLAEHQEILKRRVIVEDKSANILT